MREACPRRGQGQDPHPSRLDFQSLRRSVLEENGRTVTLSAGRVAEPHAAQAAPRTSQTGISGAGPGFSAVGPRAARVPLHEDFSHLVSRRHKLTVRKTTTQSCKRTFSSLRFSMAFSFL